MKNRLLLAAAFLFTTVGMVGCQNSSTQQSTTLSDKAYLEQIVQAQTIYSSLASEGTMTGFSLLLSIPDVDDPTKIVTATYTSSDESIMKIEGNKAVIVPFEGTTFKPVQLKAKYAYKNEKLDVTYNVKALPQAPTLTIAELKDGVSASIKAVVVAKNTRGTYVYDGTAFLYCFGNAEATVGKYYKISGKVATYSATLQFDNAKQKIEYTELTEAIPTDLKNKIDAFSPEVYKEAEMNAFAAKVTPGEYVTVRGTLKVDGNYYNVNHTDLGKYTASIVYPDATALGLAALDGKLIEVTGFAMYLTGSSSQYFNICATNVKESEVTEAEKLDIAVEALNLPATFDLTVASVPVKGSYDAAITWASSNNAILSIAANGDLTIDRKDVEQTVTLTATLKIGELTKTKTFEVKIPVYTTFNMTENIEITANKFVELKKVLGEKGTYAKNNFVEVINGLSLIINNCMGISTATSEKFMYNTIQTKVGGALTAGQPITNLAKIKIDWTATYEYAECFGIKFGATLADLESSTLVTATTHTQVDTGKVDGTYKIYELSVTIDVPETAKFFQIVRGATGARYIQKISLEKKA